MGRRYNTLTTSETVAIGIEGDRHSLAGAIKRFELQGKKSNNVLSLKEQCARRIALIKNEQIKWFVTALLPPWLFKYVTKDIFTLQRPEFTSNYPKPLYMCQECAMDTYESPSDDCQCPKMDAGIDALNQCLFKHMNNRKTKKPNEFRLVYKIPNDEMDHSDELKQRTSFFLYLSPTQYQKDYDCDGGGPFDEYNLLSSQVSAQQKLLFVDAMRFFGGFRVKYQEPQLILYRRRECEL